MNDITTRPDGDVDEVGDDNVSLLEAVQDLLDARERLGPAVVERYDLWRCLAALVEEVRS